MISRRRCYYQPTEPSTRWQGALHDAESVAGHTGAWSRRRPIHAVFFDFADTLFSSRMCVTCIFASCGL